MAPAPRVAPSAPSASTGQAATAATSAASTSALAPAAFAFPQPAAAWQSAGPPPGQMMQLQQQVVMQLQQQQAMPASQLATPQRGVPGRAASVDGEIDGDQSSLSTARLSMVQPPPTPLDEVGLVLVDGIQKIQAMWVAEPERRGLEQRGLAAIVAKMHNAGTVQGVACIIKDAENLQELQEKHDGQAQAQAEPAGALLNRALEAFEKMGAAEQLNFERMGTEPPPPAPQVSPPSTWVNGPNYNNEDPLLVRRSRSHCLLRADRAHPHHTPPRFLPRPSQPRAFARPALLLSWQPCRLQATEAVLVVPGGSASKLLSALNPRRTAVTVTVRNRERPLLVQGDGRAEGRRFETVELIRPVAGDAADGEPTIVDTGFGLLTATYMLDPPQGGGSVPEEVEPSSSAEGPVRFKRCRDASASN